DSDDCNGEANPSVPRLMGTNQAGTLLFVSNYTSSGNTVSAFTIGGNGALTLVSGSPFGTGTSGQPSMTVFPPKACGLAVNKTSDATSVTYGNAIGFTVTTSNPVTAASTATSVTLNDPLPGANGASWLIDPAYGGPGTCGITGAPGSQVLNCSLADLAAGASASVHVSGT